MWLILSTSYTDLKLKYYILDLYISYHPTNNNSSLIKWSTLSVIFIFTLFKINVLKLKIKTTVADNKILLINPSLKT